MYISSSTPVICQTTGPKPLPKRFLHIVRSRASSFNWQYPLQSLRSSSSFLRNLPRRLVTSICPFIFTSVTCCRRQFLRKIRPIQLAFRFDYIWFIFKILYNPTGMSHLRKETNSVVENTGRSNTRTSVWLPLINYFALISHKIYLRLLLCEGTRYFFATTYRGKT